MSTLTFNTPETIGNLTKMVDSAIAVLREKINHKAEYEMRMHNYKVNRENRSFWSKLFDDWREDESVEGLQNHSDYWAVYKINHSLIPDLGALQRLRYNLSLNPNVIAVSSDDLYLISTHQPK